eukprot:GHVU01229469.1.p1 GENE.GHVU01229469.1~~GHVU01229469.1.p1  ORF type:complete len:156 (+),score=17.61 GHVU01229469.1:226-693(+)
MPQVPAECLRHRRAFLISAEATEQQLLSFTLRPPTQAELAMWERHVICGRCVAYTEPCTCKSEEDDEETACLPRLPNWRRNGEAAAEEGTDEWAASRVPRAAPGRSPAYRYLPEDAPRFELLDPVNIHTYTHRWPSLRSSLPSPPCLARLFSMPV